MPTKKTKKTVSKKRIDKKTTKRVGVSSSQKKPSKNSYIVSGSVQQKLQQFSHTVIQEVRGKIVLPHVLSVPYWSNGLIVFSVILLMIKAVLLGLHGFVEVQGLWSSIKRYLGWLGNDLLYCMLIRFVGNVASRLKIVRIKTICVVVMGLLLYIFAADIFALTNFHSRFLLSGLSFFSRENAGPYLFHGIGATLVRGVGMYLSVWLVYVVAKYCNRKIVFRMLRWGVVVAIILLGISFFIPSTSSYQKNIFQVEFGTDTWNYQDTDKPYESYYKPFSGAAQRPNIIVVFVESFSSIDSQYAGGSRNLLSGFDTIARDGTFYQNFIANGCTSDTSHIALLQGVEPRETPYAQQEYTRYKSFSLPLPAFLSRQGYTSTFISTVSLDFLKQREFLTSLQFDTLIGDEAFKKWRKYVFRAAPDKALYQEAEKQILAKGDKPHFIVLQTISSHKPYDTPNGNTEEKAMQYADQELLRFYRSLQSMNYFENGILVVVGDHRKMQAMGYNEIQRRGKAAYGKTVAAVVGTGITQGLINKKPLQHWDIFFSLKRLTAGGVVNLHEYYNDMFDQYQGRDAAIRYCQFVDRQYVASRADGSSWVLSPTHRNNYASYIRSYYQFQQGREYIGPQKGSGDQISVTYPGLIRIAHQGVTTQSPPNSYDAFKAAHEMGIEAIEMDISFTKDGYPVVMHGPDIGRTKCTSAPGKKNIADFNLQEMKDLCVLYNGQVILTLQEILEKTQMMFDWYFIDVKIHKPEQRQYITQMIKAIQKLGLHEKIMFSSNDAETNFYLGAMRNTIAGWEIDGLDELETVLASNHTFVLLPEAIVNVDAIEKIIASKKIPVVYTINDASTFRQLYDWGVRYIITDKPGDIIK